MNIRYATIDDQPILMRIRALSEWSSFVNVDERKAEDSPFWFPGIYESNYHTETRRLRVADDTSGIVGFADMSFGADEEETQKAHVAGLPIAVPHAESSP